MIRVIKAHLDQLEAQEQMAEQVHPEKLVLQAVPEILVLQ